MQKDILEGMLADMKKHHRDKGDLLNNSIELRLNKSLKNYYSELMSTYNVLVRKDAIRVMRKAHREEAKKKNDSTLND